MLKLSIVHQSAKPQSDPKAFPVSETLLSETGPTRALDTELTPLVWSEKLSTKSAALLLIILLGFTAALWILMQTYGRDLVREESARTIEMRGREAVATLNARIAEIAALTRSMAEVAAQLPLQEQVFRQIFPAMLDFQGDLNVAGGGVWPEPFAFQSDRDRRSFFWARTEATSTDFDFFDDYKEPPPARGYHNEEWYVVVEHKPPGSVFWSRSYTDPYSLEPMVTCTGNVHREGSGFFGTVTVDLKLAELEETIQTWLSGSAGYAFIVDRNNRFLAFPERDRVTEAAGTPDEAFLHSGDFVEIEPLFEPIHQALLGLDQEILEIARVDPEFDSQVVDILEQASDQITKPEARMISALLVDPLATQQSQSTLHATIPLERDYALGEPANLYLFSVPAAHWKVGFVIPTREEASVADQIAQTLGLLCIVLAGGFFVAVFVSAHQSVVHPLEVLAGAVEKVGRGHLQTRVSMNQKNEIGQLARGFNLMVDRVRNSSVELSSALKRLDSALDSREAQTNQILATVNEGLCLLDAECRIQPQYSLALEKILEQDQLAGRSILDLLKPMLPGRILASAKDYIDILFADEVSHKLIRSINPVTEIEAAIEQEGGGFRTKNLSLNFERVRENGQVASVLLSIQDVTHNIGLAKRLAAAEQSTRAQVELVMNLMHVDPAALRDFLIGVNEELKLIELLLRKPDQSPTEDRQAQYKEIVHDVFRRVHSIKGNAALLRLELFEKAAHAVEDRLSKLRNQNLLTGEDFLPAVLEISNLQRVFDDTSTLISRFKVAADVKQEYQASRVSFGPALVESLSRFANLEAIRERKEIMFLHQGLEELALPFRWQKPVRDALIQLVRNAVVHGIETPRERRMLGKDDTGRLILYALQQGEFQYLILRDDGRGLDLAKIQQAAKSLGLETTGDSGDFSLIFQPGFTTRSEASSQSGRGVGLDLVRQSIIAMGGTISVQREDEFTDFFIAIPLESSSE